MKINSITIPFNCCEDIDKIETPQLKPLKQNYLNLKDLEIAKTLDDLINQPFVTKYTPKVTYITIMLVIAIIILYIGILQVCTWNPSTM